MNEEKKENIIIYNKKKLSKKLSLMYFISAKLNYCFEVATEDSKKSDKEAIDLYNPIAKLEINFEEIQNISNLEEKIYQFFYFNRKKIHKELYDNQKKINVVFDEIKNLAFYFYLYLLINEDLTIINYSYSIELIKKLNDLQNNNNDKIYKKIIIAKIIPVLIWNYKEGLDKEFYEEKKDESILNKIEEKNKIIIEKFSSKIGLEIKDEINKKNIDEIYIEIIISLIKTKKFDNYEEVFNIIEELDLQNIIITNNMFEKLSHVLNSNENYINYYLIKNIEDLYNDKKINFYYILLKFILKNSIYIYQIDILFQTKKIILKELNNIQYNNIEEKIKQKFDFVLEKITGSGYYLKIIKDMILKKLNDLNDFQNSSTRENESGTHENKSENKNGINNTYFNRSSVLEAKEGEGVDSNSSIEIYSSNVQIGNIQNNFSEIKIYYENILNKLEYTIKLKEQTNSEEQKALNDNYNNWKNKLKDYENVSKNKDEKKDENKDEIIIYNSFEKLTKFVENMEKIINEEKISDEIVLRFTGQKENGNGELKNINCEYINKSLNVKNKDNKNYEDIDILNNKYIKNFNDFIRSLTPNIDESSIKLNNNISYSSQQTTKKIINDISTIGYNSYNSLNYLKVLSQNLAVSGG